MSEIRQPRSMTIPLGVVLRRSPGVTRWAKWSWSAVAVIPNTGPGHFRLLREESEVSDYHAATVQLELHRSEVESYRTSLMMAPPSVFVALNKGENAGNAHGIDVHLVTASADEGQQWQDSDEMIVQPVAMPDALLASVRAFCDAHYEEVPYVKRKRDRKRTDLVEDGIGDPRIRQAADVYRRPKRSKVSGSD